MNLKLFRKAHMYLGCFFAPLLVFFVFSGVLQTFGFHEEHKNSSYKPPAWVEIISQIHKDQRILINDERQPPSIPFRWFVAAMSLGLLMNIGLGIAMAFKYEKPGVVIVSMILGVVVPIIVLSVPLWHKG